ncbi:unnamed protein product [Ilex paraguariensis]|uniref:Uncharacterized protein n=1 Tax=Ilex paraguariensis TaxID=185542 RepID=A0ABC8SEC5_9AQUA
MDVVKEQMDIRKGPWTLEEDLKLMDCITIHGEGQWSSLARGAGLNRTGKSCRLRWMNYLRPDIRHGNITLKEEVLILELHSRWGNRWSKIAQQLPGRTDNEIKNYWRTRVQKQAKQLNCDANSKQFRDIVRYVWLPRLVDRVRASSEASTTAQPSTAATSISIDQNNYETLIPECQQVHKTGLQLQPIEEDIQTQISGTGLDQIQAQISPLSVVSGGNDAFPDYSWCNNFEDGVFYRPEWEASPSQGFDVQALERSNDWLIGGASLGILLNDDSIWLQP